MISVVVLVIGATTVFGELQSALDRIWRVPAPPETGGIWNLLRTRLLSFGLVLGLGFLLLVSLVISAALAAFGTWWGGAINGWEPLLQMINFASSFVLVTGLFAMIYKIMPRAQHRMARCMDRRRASRPVVRDRQAADRAVPREERRASGFGAAGSLVVLLVWVYYSAQIFLLGAEFTWVYAHDHGSKAGEPGSLPLRGCQVVPEKRGLRQAPGIPTRFLDLPGTGKGTRVARSKGLAPSRRWGSSQARC